jgi:ABC-type phosphate transport system substrate-binding protein
MKSLILLAAIVVSVAGTSAAVDVQVIANPSVAVAELTADALKDIFLGARTSIGGGAVEPVFEQSGAAHERFLKSYLGKSDSALRTYFKTLVFTGKGVQPKAFASDAEVVKYIATTKGAIGYVSASADTGGARKIQVR